MEKENNKCFDNIHILSGIQILCLYYDVYFLYYFFFTQCTAIRTRGVLGWESFYIKVCNLDLERKLSSESSKNRLRKISLELF